MMLLVAALCVLFFTLILYMVSDVHYFVRLGWLLIQVKLRGNKRTDVFDEHITQGICTTNDLDFSGHMNNARFLREMDFSRIKFWLCTGLYQEATKMKSVVVQSACSVRYRRTVQLHQSFRVVSKLICWEDRHLYVEQRVESSKGFVMAIALTRQTAKGASIPDIIEKTVGKKLTSPEAPPELKKWIESNDLSSERLLLQGSKPEDDRKPESDSPDATGKTKLS